MQTKHLCRLTCWGLVVFALALAVGCDRTENRNLAIHRFPDGETVRIELHYDNSDPDIAWGGGVSAQFDKCEDAEYIGLVRDEPWNLELEKIQSANTDCVCFSAVDFSKHRVLIVVCKSNSKYTVSRPLKPGYPIDETWGSAIVDKVAPLVNKWKDAR